MFYLTSVRVCHNKLIVCTSLDFHLLFLLSFRETILIFIPILSPIGSISSGTMATYKNLISKLLHFLNRLNL